MALMKNSQLSIGRPRHPRYTHCGLSRNITLVLLILIGVIRSAHSQSVDFARDIRPILSENCSFCHGPDEQTRKADLRLDEASGVWSVLEKGDSESSELLRRLVTDDIDELMPPPDSNRSLSEKQIQTVRQWIDQGASWDQHWSFKRLKKTAIPEVDSTDTTPIRNPIDAFVQHRLLASPLHASPEASAETLIRRLCLDLTGLPPTPDQLAEFLNDHDDGAYERLVDRLLDSEHYGQRMAWTWLDAARYADTNGYQGDGERTMWPWRDWVINAFNRNLPYDDFTVWQLAGDLLPNATHEQKLATGFNRNHMINGEGGRIAEENRVEYVMDMTETMGTIWMGMTLNCCRCHDHKFDPIQNEEYYQLFSFFNQTSVNGGGGNAQTPPILASPTPAEIQDLNSLEEKLKDIDGVRQNREKELIATQLAWSQTERERLEQLPAWKSLSITDANANLSELEMLDDLSLLAKMGINQNQPPNNDTYVIRGKVMGNRVTALRIDALTHPTLGGGLSHADSGNFVLTEVSVRVVDAEGKPISDQTPKIKNAEATFEQGSHAISTAFDGNPKTGWAVYQGKRVDQSHSAMFRFENMIKVPPQHELEITLAHDSVHDRHNLGRFLISISDEETPQLDDGRTALLNALRIDPANRSTTQNDLITKSHQDSDARLSEIQLELKETQKQIQQKRNAFPKVMVMEDQQSYRKTFLLERGLYNQVKQEVQPGFPQGIFSVRPPVSDSSNVNHDSPATLNRLDLANWLVHPDNPLTARVTVNRFWQQFFGMGLVKTLEDFGTQGENPIHRELLDWLAMNFQSNGWNVKELVRLMVTSHTYRQSSVIPSQQVYDTDPENRLLSRASRHRLPAWMIRDQALAVSGLLSPNLGGPSVNTYQPPGVWEEASFGKKKYRQDTGEKLYRRSLYVFWRRIIAPTMFFDNASRQTCTVRSSRTNTPLHALQTLNGVTYVEAARALAEKAIVNHPITADSQIHDKTDKAILDWIMKRTLSRLPSREEQKILLNGLERDRQLFIAKPNDAKDFLSAGESERNNSIDPIEHAAWSSLCLAILNFDETLNRE